MIKKFCFGKRYDKICLLQIQPKAPPAKHHVDSSFTAATKYVSFASTSLY
jgi:hypothetical protein